MTKTMYRIERREHGWRRYGCVEAPVESTVREVLALSLQAYGNASAVRIVSVHRRRHQWSRWRYRREATR